jgi:NADP-dependent 3-hydroxy acid dehydrogenase YdfG
VSRPLEGLTAIVTGAGTGIGAATAARLAGAGCRVVLMGRRADVLEQRAAGITAHGGQALAMPGDVRDFAQVDSVVRSTIERYGAVDIYVANAAVVDHATIEAGDPTEWAELIATNVLGVMYGARAVVPHLLERRTGHFVIVASISGRVTYVGEPAYVASKHATVAFADVLRQEVSRSGIRVTVVEPGLVATPLVWAHADAVARVVPRDVVPLDPDDCARAIQFALEQPASCTVSEIVLRPTAQL